MRVTEDRLTIYDGSFVAAAEHPLWPRASGQRRRGPDHQPPRDPRRRLEQLRARFAELGGGGSPVPGGSAGRQPARQESGRAGPGPGGGLLPLGRYRGAGAGRARRRLQPGGRAAHPGGAEPAPAPLHVLADDHRTYLDRLLEREPTPPRPTSDYQALLGEGPRDGEPIVPPWEELPERRRVGRRRPGRDAACMTTSPPRSARWASP